MVFFGRGFFSLCIEMKQKLNFIDCLIIRVVAAVVVRSEWQFICHERYQVCETNLH